MAITKLNLDRQTEGRVLALGTTTSGGEALLTLNKGIAALSTVVLDVKGSQSIAGDLNLVGNLNITGSINEQAVTTLSVADLNITVNKGGTTAGAASAGLFVEGDSAAVIGKILFDNTLTSKWKIGDGATQVEVVTVSGAQTLTNKTIGGGQITGNITGNAGNVTGTVAVGNGGTGAITFTAGYLKASGTSAFTTVATIPGADISGNITGSAGNVTGIVSVANGGTGKSSITTGALLVGNGTGAATELVGGTSGYVVTWNGSAWVAQAPTGTTAYQHELTVSGTQDGANKTFTISNAISAGSLQFFINGALLRAGASNDYTLSGTTVTLTAGYSAPASTDSIVAYGTY